MSEKFGPCLEKNCSHCCDPVKVGRFFSEEDVPINKDGNKIWMGKNELLVSVDVPDGQKLKTYNCVNFDAQTGKCKDYNNRPEICRNTSCVSADSTESIDEQHTKFVGEKFISISKK